MTKPDTKTVVAVLGAIGTVIGLLFNLTDRWRDLPDLELTGDSVQLQSRQLDTRSVVDQLADIEAELGAYTDLAVIDLRDKASSLSFDYSPEGRQAVETFAGELQNTIREFDAPARRVSISDVRYKNGVLLGPGGEEFAINEPRASIAFPSDLLARLRQNTASPSEADVRALREYALTEVFGGGDGDQEGRKRVSERLRRIRTQLTDLLERKADSLLARITLRNKSRQPTVVVPTAVLRLTQGGRQSSIELKADEPVVLEPYTLRILTLASHPLASLSAEDRETVQMAFTRDSQFTVAVMDIHKKVWTTPKETLDGRGSTLYRNALIRALDDM